MSRKFFDIKFMGKTKKLINATVLAKNLREIKAHTKKLGFSLKSVKPHKVKGQWGF